MSGVLWEKLGLEKYVRRLKDSGEDSREDAGAYEKSFRSRLRRAARVGWGEFRRALPYLVAGDDVAHRSSPVGERNGDRRDHGSRHRRSWGEHTRGERVGEHLQAPAVDRLPGNRLDYRSGGRVYVQRAVLMGQGVIPLTQVDKMQVCSSGYGIASRSWLFARFLTFTAFLVC